MRKLRFKELWILSGKEKKAWNINLDHDVIAVIGDNECGKSSFVKSLYSAFGADPFKTPEAWREIGASILLKFSINGVVYYILREGMNFSLFDENEKKLWSISEIKERLSHEISRMFDFNIDLVNSDRRIIPPFPYLCFVPFYIDQDNSWNRTWEPFEKGDDVADHKKDIAYFHTGIRPREYYLAKANKREAVSKRTHLNQEKKALLRAEVRLKTSNLSIGIALDPKIFAERIDALVKEQNILQDSYEKTKKKISSLQSDRAVAFEEMSISHTVYEELKRDISYVKTIDDLEVICPTCNTIHKNDFSNNFGLMNDAELCQNIFQESRKKVSKLDIQIESELGRLSSNDYQIKKISNILNERIGVSKFKDILRVEGQNIVDEILSNEISIINRSVLDLNDEIKRAEERMKEFSEESRENTILSFYREKLEYFCNYLNIDSPPKGAFLSILPRIDESGSGNPRLYLAYYYAILHVIRDYSTSCFCPIVIDTPLQQDQDLGNAERMIEFIISQRPSDSQLFLATGSLHGVAVPGKTINLYDKNSLLKEDHYKVVKDFMQPFIEKSIWARID